MESEWVKLPEGVPPFMHISQNDSSGKKQGKLKEDDIAVCECKYDGSNSEGACGESCLNVLTSTECTPGYCPCNEHCRNQKFQKCEYAKTKLFKTEGRGWGLLADQDMKAGQFIIEYCGEIISSKEAKQRSQTYETQGLKDAYIISLNANYFIDATTKGSLARFINHSCQPNCETRKWTVLGETRVGIFAIKDISVGTELAYDYNFEWYGGATVRCLCGAANCSLFLGAKSHGFQEYNHVWEDGDDRYTVENVPLYDSAEDEHFPTIPFSAMENKAPSEIKIEAATNVESHFSFSAQHVAGKSVETETNKKSEFDVEDSGQSFTQRNPMMSRVRGINIGPGPSGKRSQHTPKPQRAKTSSRKHTTSKPFAQLFKSKKAQEEIRRCEELKNKATSELNAVYDEIRPTIEEHERDNQDSVPTSVADKWIKASCGKMSADFNLSFAILKNAIFPPNEKGPAPAGGAGDDKDETK